MDLDNAEYTRRRRLTTLVKIVNLRRSELAHPDARRHLFEGYIRRLWMMDAIWHHLRELVLKDPPRALSSYQATETGIHVNAYYLNLCGALDNLAWTLQYEWDLLTGVTESGGNRTKCVLFGSAFLAAVLSHSEELATRLQESAGWNTSLRLLRDPAAHRIPIYVPPAVLNETAAAEYQHLQAESTGHAELGNLDRMMELQFEATEVGKFQPLMILSDPSGLQIESIKARLTKDQEEFLAVSESVLRTVFPRPPA